MAQKLRNYGKKLEKTSVGCHIDFTILLSMLKVNQYLLAAGFHTMVICLEPFLILAPEPLSPYFLSLERKSTVCFGEKAVI